MKQTISKKQWEELSKEEQDIYAKKIYIDLIIIAANGYPTIGQLIEFLGDDLWVIHQLDVPDNNKRKRVWYLEDAESGIDKDKCFDELIDALWEAVKYKLKS